MDAADGQEKGAYEKSQRVMYSLNRPPKDFPIHEAHIVKEPRLNFAQIKSNTPLTSKNNL